MSGPTWTALRPTIASSLRTRPTVFRRRLTLHVAKTTSLLNSYGLPLLPQLSASSSVEAAHAFDQLAGASGSRGKRRVEVRAGLVDGELERGEWTTGLKGARHVVSKRVHLLFPLARRRRQSSAPAHPAAFHSLMQPTPYDSDSASQAGSIAAAMLGSAYSSPDSPAFDKPCSTALLTQLPTYASPPLRLLLLADRVPYRLPTGKMHLGPSLLATRLPSTVPVLNGRRLFPSSVSFVPLDVTKAVGDDGAAVVGEEEMSALLDGEVGQDLEGVTREEIRRIVNGLWKAFWEKDGTRFEVEVALQEDGSAVVSSHSLAFDTDAAYRQKELFALDDPLQVNPLELEAKKVGMVYRKFGGGNIGCMGYGAGMGMSTVDGLLLAGGKPANFLDGGGGATAENAKQALGFINKDPDVRSIFVNIFGGITRTDWVAQGMIDAVRTLGIKVPLIVRLRGNKAEEAKAILNESNLPFRTFDDFREAAAAATKAASEEQVRE